MTTLELPQAARQVLDKLAAGTLKVGVIGMGYVGLPLAEIFCRSGYHVTGFDVDASKIDALNRGESYIGDVTTDQVREQVKAGRLAATTDFDGLAEMDAILICVPTPLRKTLDPDISYVMSAAEEIKTRLRPGQVIVLESTTYPGTTEEAMLPLLESTGLKVGQDFFLAFSPERVDPSNEKYKTENTPKVVGGVTPACNDVTCKIYSRAIPKVHPVSSARAAEMVKLLENTFRLINIGLVNEIALISERLELDVWEVIDAAATKPFGFMAFYPGPGLGGHCIPIDPHYLSWKLRSLNYFTRFIDLASEINRSMPQHAVQKLALLLNEQGRPLKGTRVLVMGVTYKRDCADTRESPAMDVMHLLLQRGVKLSFYDPYVTECNVEGHDIPAVPYTTESVKQHDAVVILTDHTTVDYGVAIGASPLVFDTRNATKDRGTKAPHVFKL